MSALQIQQLAELIRDKTNSIGSYLVEHKLPAPSFDADGPLDSPIPKSEAALEDARLEVIEALDDLKALMMGPKEYLLSFGHSDMMIHQAISRFKLAHAVPVDGEATFAEIAHTCGVNEVQVQRLMRFAISRRIFKEPRRNCVAHTAASRALREDPDLQDMIGWYSDEMWPAASQTVNAIAKWPGSQEPTETGFALANGTDKPFYDFFNDHPERARRFANTLDRRAKTPGYSLSFVGDLFPWEELGDGTVVDVGGSHAQVASYLAQRFPRLKFIVQDLSSVIKGREEGIPDALKERITFQAHDFFTPQTAAGADVYFLKQIFHNWSDKYSLKILQNLVPALKPGARVVVCDLILPQPGVMPPRIERALRNLDMSQLEFQNSLQREHEDWISLFQRADKRFRLNKVGRQKESVFSILDFVWEG